MKKLILYTRSERPAHIGVQGPHGSERGKCSDVRRGHGKCLAGIFQGLGVTFSLGYVSKANVRRGCPGPMSGSLMQDYKSLCV